MALLKGIPPLVIRRVGAALVVVALVHAPRSPSAARTATEAEIKAAYLYHFTKFVEWPSEATDGRDVFAVCVAGDAAFAEVVEHALSERRVHDRPIRVYATERDPLPPACHVFYCATGWGPSTPELAAAMAHRGTLVVADDPSADDWVIAFVPRGKNVRFVTNVDVAERAGLKVSSQLLKLAVEVIGAPGEASP